MSESSGDISASEWLKDQRKRFEQGEVIGRDLYNAYIADGGTESRRAFGVELWEMVKRGILKSRMANGYAVYRLSDDQLPWVIKAHAKLAG